MKKLLSFALVLLVVLSACVLPAFALVEVEDEAYYSRFRGQKVTLNVYNWGEYISDGSDDSMNVNKEFEELTGIKVIYTTFANNEELYAKLRSGGVSYDVVIPSEYMVSRMIKENMLEPLNLNNIPNFKNIAEEFLNQSFDPGNHYSVPYTWGTVGLIYNTTMVDPEDDIASWDILWNEKYLGEILMFANPRDAFGIAMKRIGYGLNAQSTDQIDEAARALAEQKPLVQAYVMDEIFDKMTGGEAAIAPYYAGDAVTMIGDNPDLAFAVPREGTNIFIDAVCIPKGAKQKEAAEMYINFLCEPEVSAANADYLGYGTPNEAARELIDEETAENPIIYPSAEVIEKAEYFYYMDPALATHMDERWTEMLSADQMYSDWLIPTLMVAGILASFIINFNRTLRKRRENEYPQT